jgi:hypothetical protein
MTSRSAAEQLLRPVITWLEEGGDAWEMDVEYWRARRELMDGGEKFDGPGWELFSNIDTAMDAFSPDPIRPPFDIDEPQLRAELEVAISSLRGLGVID